MKKVIWILTGSLIMVQFSACQKMRNKKYKNEVIERSIQWGDYERTYYVHLPNKITENERLPVLFSLHGGGGDALGSIGSTYGRFNELSDEYRFIVVYPDAMDHHWNDGRTMEVEKAWIENVDDVGFLVAVLEELAGEYRIDRNRVFTTGISNGGFMSTRLICDRPDVFSGAAIVTATISEDYFPRCHPDRPVGVLVMNGTSDPLVPYNGGQIRVLRQDRGAILSTDDFIRFWVEKNGCNDRGKTRMLPDLKKDDTRIEVTRYDGCSSPGSVVLYKINGGGHTWPGGQQYLPKSVIGTVSRDINACDEIWEYFSGL